MSKKIDLGQLDSPTNSNFNDKSSEGKVFNRTLPQFKSRISEDSSSDDTQISINFTDKQRPFVAKSAETVSIEKELKKSVAKKKRSWKKYIIFIFVLLVLTLGSYGGFKAYQAFSDLKRGGVDVSLGDLINNVVAKKEDPQLLKDGNLTNVLVLGVDTRSGGSGGGLENTDSMMIASLNHDTKKVALISVPRDNYVPFHVGKNNKTIVNNRINAAFAIAQDYNYPGGGLTLLRTALSEMTGLQIQYTVQVDFQAFKQVIDRLGGITVNVERSFTDYEYPNDTDTGLITVSFKQGVQEMNGTKALQFARSRHSVDNGEGSDFARARRQQQILVAVQDKIKKTNFFTDPNAVTDFIKIFGDNVKIQKTADSSSLPGNIDITDINAVMALKDKFSTSDYQSIVLDPSIGGCNALIHKLDGYEAYYIGPTAGVGKFEDIKKFVNYAITNPTLYNENKQNCSGNSDAAQIGFVDNGYGYTNTVNEAANLAKNYLDSSYAAVLKSPIGSNPVATTSIVKTTSVTNTGNYKVYIWDITKKKPNTKTYLMQKYNAQELTDTQIPDIIKNISKNYDIFIFLSK